MDSIDRRCLGLSLALLDHELYRNECQSAVVSFLASLGIDMKNGKVELLWNITSDLSAVVKIGRLIIVPGYIDSPLRELQHLYKRIPAFDGRTTMPWDIGLARVWEEAV